MAAGNKVLLIIMDGWGLSASEQGNGPLLSNTPTLDYIYKNYPKTSLTASGLEVGLSDGEPGNSEVGHLNIGSGRVVWENLPRIDQEIESGAFFKNEALLQAINYAKKNDSTLHLIGLVSDGGVHSHIRHLQAILKLAGENKLKKVLVHFIGDGRDTAPEVADAFAKELDETFKKTGVGRVATLIGRYFAMDRDKNWGREKKATDLYLQNAGDKYESLEAAIEANYKNKKSDEFFEPSVIGEGGIISANDSVIIFNHRSDRSRQLMNLLSGAERTKVPAGVLLTTMTEYENGQKAPVIYPPVNLINTLSDVISVAGLTQLHTAETEKYAHVTYFFKAGNEKVLKGETDKVVPSKKTTYDKLPEMSAPAVADQVVKGIEADFNFIVVNFANGDMVGHTGKLTAVLKACEAVDNCLAKVMPPASEHGYKVFITADHGNCETMIDELTKQPNKEHTTNPVPFVFADTTKKPFQFELLEYSKDDYLQYAVGTPIGVLADIAPSILANLDLKKPAEIGGMDLSVAMI